MWGCKNEISEANDRGSINGNAYQSLFWLIAHVLFDKSLCGSLKAEMRPALDPKSTAGVNMAYLLDTKTCPLLNSLYEEVLRTTNDPMGVRVVTDNVTIGSKVLCPGHKLLMPYKQLHFNPDIFGSDAASFDPRRFQQRSESEKGVPLAKSSWFRPFGGATGYCPGRFLARREVFLFTALMLFRFETKVFGRMGKKPAFPRIDTATPTGGILRPIPGDDVLLEVRLAHFK